MQGELRLELHPEELVELTDDNLFRLLGDIQKLSTNLFQEAWRRGIHMELAAKGMQLKEGPIQ